MKLYRRYFPTIMSGQVVRWYFNPHKHKDVFDGETYTGDGQVSASRDGIVIQGFIPTITEESEIKKFSRLLQAAFTVHKKLKEREELSDDLKVPCWIDITDEMYLEAEDAWTSPQQI